MIDEREIWACANHMLKRYGADAWFHAAQRADELLAEGDFEGQRTWCRILDRIHQLDATEAAGSLQ